MYMPILLYTLKEVPYEFVWTRPMAKFTMDVINILTSGLMLINCTSVTFTLNDLIRSELLRQNIHCIQNSAGYALTV